MTDHATPNLLSRDFANTSAFYAGLGFVETWRDDGWMILARGSVTLEFFPHPKLDPLTSWSSCCLRLDDLDAFYTMADSNRHGFCLETRDIITALSDRITRENRELYPLAERLDRAA